MTPALTPATGETPELAGTPTTADLIALDEDARQRHAEIRLLLIAILVVSVVGVVLLAWDALD